MCGRRGWTRSPAFPRNLINGGLGYLTAVARIAPGVRVEQAQSEVDAIAHGYARANPTNTDADPDASLRLVPIRERTVGSARSPLLVLMGAVGLVLLIACANVANLLLVRATARSHEAAVRLALGASRWDLTRWMCSESLLLSLTGGVLGVLLAFWSVDLAASALQGLPRGSEIAVDGRVLAFSLAVSIAAGLIFGLIPASLAARQSPVDALKSGGRGATGSRRGPRNALVIAEVALSLMLLVGAGLLLQSFARLTRVPVGFKAGRPAHVPRLAADLRLRRSRGDALVHRAPDAEARGDARRRARRRVDGAAAGDHDDGAVCDRRSADGRDRRAAGGAVVRDHAGLLRDDGDSDRRRARDHRCRHRALAARRRHQPGAGAPRVAERVADRQEDPGRALSRIRRGRRRRRRREEQRPRARADARDVHAVSAAAVAGRCSSRCARPAAIRSRW